MLCTKFQNEWAIEIDFMDEWDFVRFGLKEEILGDTYTAMVNRNVEAIKQKHCHILLWWFDTEP